MLDSAKQTTILTIVSLRGIAPGIAGRQVHLIEIAFDDIVERDRVYDLIERLLSDDPTPAGTLSARSENV